MRPCGLAPRILALILSLALALPGPALALRVPNAHEGGLEEDLAAALHPPGTGLEEQAPQRFLDYLAMFSSGTPVTLVSVKGVKSNRSTGRPAGLVVRVKAPAAPREFDGFIPRSWIPSTYSVQTFHDALKAGKVSLIVGESSVEKVERGWRLILKFRVAEVSVPQPTLSPLPPAPLLSLPPVSEPALRPIEAWVGEFVPKGIPEATVRALVAIHASNGDEAIHEVLDGLVPSRSRSAGLEEGLDRYVMYLRQLDGADLVREAQAVLRSRLPEPLRARDPTLLGRARRIVDRYNYPLLSLDSALTVNEFVTLGDFLIAAPRAARLPTAAGLEAGGEAVAARLRAVLEEKPRGYQIRKPVAEVSRLWSVSVDRVRELLTTTGYQEQKQASGRVWWVRQTNGPSLETWRMARQETLMEQLPVVVDLLDEDGARGRLREAVERLKDPELEVVSSRWGSAETPTPFAEVARRIFATESWANGRSQEALTKIRHYVEARGVVPAVSRPVPAAGLEEGARAAVMDEAAARAVVRQAVHEWLDAAGERLTETVIALGPSVLEHAPELRVLLREMAAGEFNRYHRVIAVPPAEELNDRNDLVIALSHLNDVHPLTVLAYHAGPDEAVDRFASAAGLFVTGTHTLDVSTDLVATLLAQIDAALRGVPIDDVDLGALGRVADALRTLAQQL